MVRVDAGMRTSLSLLTMSENDTYSSVWFAPRARLPAPQHTSIRPGEYTLLPTISGSRTCGRCPARAAPQDFPRLISLFQSLDPGDSSPVVRALFARPVAAGRRLGTDSTRTTGVDARVPNPCAPGCPTTCRAPTASGSRRRCRSTRVRDRPRGGPRDREPDRCTASCTWAGCPTVRAATAARWRYWSSRTDSWAAYMAAIAPFRHVVVYPTVAGASPLARRRSAPGVARQVAVPDGLRGA